MPLIFHKKPALVVYVTCGDPDLATTREIVLAAIAAGADVIELGVPFSDPVADGPVIQRASERALKHGTSLGQVLKLAAEIRQQAQSKGLIVFSYVNPILRMGLEKFCKVTRHAGLDGALLTDLPVEEAGQYLREMRQTDLATIFLAATPRRWCDGCGNIRSFRLRLDSAYRLRSNSPRWASLRMRPWWVASLSRRS